MKAVRLVIIALLSISMIAVGIFTVTQLSAKQPDSTICRLLGDQLHIRTADAVVDKTVTHAEISQILLEHFGIPYFDIPMEKPLCAEF